MKLSKKELADRVYSTMISNYPMKYRYDLRANCTTFTTFEDKILADGVEIGAFANKRDFCLKVWDYIYAKNT
jgi:hypothetical protein